MISSGYFKLRFQEAALLLTYPIIWVPVPKPCLGGVHRNNDDELLSNKMPLIQNKLTILDADIQKLYIQMLFDHGLGATDDYFNTLLPSLI